MTTPNIKALAEKAIQLGKAATRGPWARNGVAKIETGDAWRLSVAICYSDEDRSDGVTKQEMANNCQLIAEYRTIAPELASALLRVLDKIESSKRNPAFNSFDKEWNAALDKLMEELGNEQA